MAGTQLSVVARTAKKQGAAKWLLRAMATCGASIFVAIVAFLYQHRRRQAKLENARAEWLQHVDLGVVQAVLMSTERFKELGRVEKRTMFIKSVTEIFKNSYICEKIMKAAQAASENGEPFFLKQLEQDDKWHVLTECQHHLSSLFAPYHIFFNEASRTQSYYHSAWYCFTLTCHRTEGQGRFFITPAKPARKDVGMMRMRIVMISEKELRDIASGSIEPPQAGFFSSRHEGRWQVLAEFAEIFAEQLRRGNTPAHSGTSSLRAAKGSRNPIGFHSFQDMSGTWSTTWIQDSKPSEHKPEHNTFLRVHVPFPSSKPLPDPQDKSTRHDEIGTQDVVFGE